MPAPTSTTEMHSHVMMFMAASALGTERTTPPAALDALLQSAPPSQTAEAAVRRVDAPMSATVLLAMTPPSASAATPITAACATLGEEQLVSHELLDRLVKRLLPVLAREAPGANAAAASNALPATLSAQSPLHSDLQDRVKRQREVNRRLRGLLERVVV